MIATARYSGDDIDVRFVCQMERADYGVPRSPSWWEPVMETVEIQDLEILAVTVDPKTLPKALYVAIFDLADGLEWEAEVE